MIAVILLVCPTLLRKYGKRNMSLVGIILALIGHLIYLINPMDFNWVVASCVIRGIFFAPLCSVIFGFFGDCIEYSQWKFHVRQEGLIFSGGSVGTKIGSGVTSAALTGLLSYAGYVYLFFSDEELSKLTGYSVGKVLSAKRELITKRLLRQVYVPSLKETRLYFGSVINAFGNW